MAVLTQWICQPVTGHLEVDHENQFGYHVAVLAFS